MCVYFNHNTGLYIYWYFEPLIIINNCCFKKIFQKKNRKKILHSYLSTTLEYGIKSTSIDVKVCSVDAILTPAAACVCVACPKAWLFIPIILFLMICTCINTSCYVR